jgi:acetaldehyde dehydrogenase
VNISDIEVSSSIASKSAGPATRLNIDEYIESTENLVKLITNCNSVKSILVLNPAEPPIMMRTTVQVKVADCDLSAIKQELKSIVDKVKRYVPGYEVVVEPYSPSKNVISATVKVSGAGYFLPTYAGNLDIINAAAIETARRYILAKKEFSQLEKKL